MFVRLLDRFPFKTHFKNCPLLFKIRIPNIPSNQMSKNISQSADGKQNRIKIKGKSKFPPGIVKFQVLGSGANGAPRCLYLFTDHSR